MDNIFEEEGQKTEFSQCMDAIKTLNNNMLNGFEEMRADIRKRRRAGFLAGAVLCFIYGVLFIIGTIGVSFTNNSNNMLTEENTVELSVTIAKIQPIPYSLRMQEYNAIFLISDGMIVTDMDGLGNLKAGDTLVIRIKNSDKNKLNSLSSAIHLCYLKSSSEIITLESYNDYYYPQTSSVGAVIVLLILSMLCMSGGFICSYFYKRNKGQKLKKLKERDSDKYLR